MSDSIAFEMVGILLALAIQAPFVSGDSSCMKLDNIIPIINNISNTTYDDISYSSTAIYNDSTGSNTTPVMLPPELSVWEKDKYTYIAIIMTGIFVLGTTLLLVFVQEKHG